MIARPRPVVIAAAGVAVAAAIGACAPTREADRVAGERPHREPPSAALFTAEGGPVTPGEPPGGLSGTSPGDCSGCHAEIAAEWASSAHARSWTDPIFQAEYRLTGQAFCRHCHAPLALDAAGPGAASELAGAAGARGIDCAVCHVRDGHVLGAHGRGGDDHAVRTDARLATTALCAGCHQFDFPRPAPGERARYHPGRPLQNTVAEWSQSRYADRPCQGCHMAITGDPARPHRSHAFGIFDDPALLARAVRVTAHARRRAGGVRVTVEIAPGEIGHAFPTGDLFRRAVLTVRAGTARRSELLMRRFAQTITDDGSGHLLGQVDDARIPPPGAGPPARLELDLPDARATDVAWSLMLFRMAPDDARDRGLDGAAIGQRIGSGRIAIAAP